MTHIIVTHNAADDRYVPESNSGDTVCVFSFNGVSDGVSIRHTVAGEFDRAGLSLSPMAEDLLNLAMTVYSADMHVLRSTGYDSWTRDFRLCVPVVALDQWIATKDTLEELISFLTGDHWKVEFRQRTIEQVVESAEPRQQQLPIEPPMAVSLFSGGLDSFIGAIDCLESQQGTLTLVGHHGAGTTNRVQEQAFGAINTAYPDRTSLLRFYVQPAMPDGPAEKTTRSRSIVFLALGTAVASSYQQTVKLLVPENGLISLNPPLTDTRMGSLSTRTTHPHFLALFSSLLEQLDVNVSLETPYRFLTKGEMIQKVKNNSAFTAGVHETLSCSHPDVGRYQGNSPGQHCGYCFPCLIRRAALASADLDDPGRYLNDVRTTRPLHGSETGRDLRALTWRFDDSKTCRTVDIFSRFYQAAQSRLCATDKYVDVYRHGMDELRRFLEA